MRWHTSEERPDDCRRIIALYDDGSGARMFFVIEGRFFDQDGDEQDEFPDNCSLWTYLPDGFALWCEDRRDDPMKFPAQNAASQGQRST